MVEVKPFPFPTFDDWYANKCQWSYQIGMFYCEIHRTGWIQTREGVVTQSEYGCAIAPNSVPLNVYVTPVTRRHFIWDTGDLNDLKDWYNKVIKLINADWERHIRDNYLV